MIINNSPTSHYVLHSPSTSGHPPNQLSCQLLNPDPTYIDPLISLAPTQTNLSELVLSSAIHSDLSSSTSDSNPNAQRISHHQISKVFTSAFLRAASIGDSDLLDWLLRKPNHLTNLPSNLSRSALNHSQISSDHSISSVSKANPSILPPGQARNWVNVDARDEDGSPALILAAAFGHAEAVKSIIDGIGGDIIDSRDAVGWTALHWAARNGDLTIVSYLLNHGASPSLLSFSDRPSIRHCQSSSSSNNLHLISSSPSSITYSETSSISTLDDLDQSLSSSPTTPSPSRRRKRRRGLRPYDLAKPDQEGDNIRHILRITESSKFDLASLNSSQPINPDHSKTEIQSLDDHSKSVIQLAQLAVKTLQLPPEIFGLVNHNSNSLQNTNLSSQTLQNEFSNFLSITHSNIEWEQEQRSEDFDWNQCLPDQMLVCSLDELPSIFKAVIQSIQPQPGRLQRFIPANVLFLCARFAGHMGGEELLEEVILGAVDRIEEVILAKQENLANSTFWLSNTICLLYYIKRDPLLNKLSLEYQLHLDDLINEIFVFIIRDAERKLDKMIDSAILDFDFLPGQQVEFEPEGSWKFVKALTSKRTKNSLFRSSMSHSTFSSPLQSSKSSSGFPISSTTRNMQRPSSISTILPLSHQTLKPLHLNGPERVTDLLSSVLYILQSYEIHASLIAQAFAQIFYWMSSELFNRIISRRKYLCRSKSIQIRLNVTVLEDWVRVNRLPPKVIGQYLQPLDQLLRWLQCLSQQTSFDQLIETLSTLKSLNPVQLLKASRDYRFEVLESKMSEECRQYLVQTQQDWDKRRIRRATELEERETAEKEMTGAESLGAASILAMEAQKAELASKASKALDETFAEGDDYDNYEPPSAPECLGELLDSRHMLPFTLPSAFEILMQLRSTSPFGFLKSYFISNLKDQDKESLNFSEDLVFSDEDQRIGQHDRTITSEEEGIESSQSSSTKLVDKEIESPDSSIVEEITLLNSSSAATLPKITHSKNNCVDDGLKGIIPIVSQVVLRKIDKLKI
ncbi:hypothetical protein O181_024775 [Austropuccinia psidii MF-1]|uniref:Dilute domain-containing protein n=1 Tax=Austropuccinia psidii MF-1 TaxID=1389203 RepID=A0A9Q3CL64_9BASI|nr:hypothetical protein [Austropuccinia psidii MF-1]